MEAVPGDVARLEEEPYPLRDHHIVTEAVRLWAGDRFRAAAAPDSYGVDRALQVSSDAQRARFELRPLARNSRPNVRPAGRGGQACESLMGDEELRHQVPLAAFRAYYEGWPKGPDWETILSSILLGVERRLKTTDGQGAEPPVWVGGPPGSGELEAGLTAAIASLDGVAESLASARQIWRQSESASRRNGQRMREEARERARGAREALHHAAALQQELPHTEATLMGNIGWLRPALPETGRGAPTRFLSLDRERDMLEGAAATTDCTLAVMRACLKAIPPAEPAGPTDAAALAAAAR